MKYLRLTYEHLCNNSAKYKSKYKAYIYIYIYNEKKIEIIQIVKDH